MTWIGRKLDSLIGAAFAAVGGLSCSQFQAFIHQYLQRLGGHLDEARNTAAGMNGFALDDAARQAIRAAAEVRVAELQVAMDAIGRADALNQPIAFARHVDWQIAKRALTEFHPAIPIDTVSLIYAAVGFVAGLLIYDFVKLPFGRRRQRL